MEAAVWYYANEVKASASFEGGGKITTFVSRGRSSHLLVSTTQVSITRRSTTVVGRIAEYCWILPERGVARVPLPDGWWGWRREGQPFRAAPAITPLICLLFAFGEYTAHCSLAVNSDFECLYFFVSFYPLHTGLLKDGFHSRSSQLLPKYFELAKTIEMELFCRNVLLSAKLLLQPGGLLQAGHLGSQNFCVLEARSPCARE